MRGAKAGAALLVAATLIGCGGDDDTASSTTAAGADTTTTAAAETTTTALDLPDAVAARLPFDVDAFAGVPGGFAVGAGAIWVPSSANGSVVRVDAATGEVSEVVVTEGRRGGPPSINAVAFADGLVWTGDRIHRTVVAIDPMTNQVVRTIDVAAATYDIDLFNGSLWVTDYETGEVVHADAATGTVLGRVDLGGAAGVAATATGAWVGTGDTITPIDGATHTAGTPVPVGNGEQVVAGGGAIWSYDKGNQAIVRVDESTGDASQLDAPVDDPAAATIAFAAGQVWLVGGDEAGVVRVADAAGTALRAVAAAGTALGDLVADGDTALWTFAGAEGDRALVRIDTSVAS